MACTDQFWYLACTSGPDIGTPFAPGTSMKVSSLRSDTLLYLLV